MRWFSSLLLIMLIVVPFVAAQDDADDDEAAFFPLAFTTTSHRQDGNRAVAGSGTFPDVTAYNVPLPDEPLWVVGAAVGESEAVWIVAASDGSLRGVFNFGGEFGLSDPLNVALPDGMPPLMVGDQFGSFIDSSFPANMAALTHATRAIERTAYISDAGELILLDGDNTPLAIYQASIAPDSRIALNDIGLAAVFIGATDSRYVHGVLGDDLESSALVVMDMGFGQIAARIDLPGEQVFEGIAPMWADVSGNGRPDIITTVSDGESGARIVVYRADGTRLAEGPAVGRGERWRHQLAWANFGVNGEPLLAEVLTPHIGGIVGLFRFDGDNLQRVARLEGYTSHVAGSRNLDMAVAGDFNGDGQAEIVLTTQDRRSIAGLGLNADGTMSERWSFPLDGELVTNMSAVTLADGRIALAVGVRGDDGAFALRLWTPD